MIVEALEVFITSDGGVLGSASQTRISTRSPSCSIFCDAAVILSSEELVGTREILESLPDTPTSLLEAATLVENEEEMTVGASPDDEKMSG